MPNNSLKITSDGSHSVFSNHFDALYHSKHGAIQESMHVFIEAGLRYYINTEIESDTKSQPINILEMGFGTGLNLLLTYIEGLNLNHPIHYSTVEAYPISTHLAKSLNYAEQLGSNELKGVLLGLHESKWDVKNEITDRFTYQKYLMQIQDSNFDQQFDIVYYDAFAPQCQEELWTPEIFKHISQYLHPRSVLVSYCAKGDFKRALLSAGFSIQKIPGPPGKREMIRAIFEGN